MPVRDRVAPPATGADVLLSEHVSLSRAEAGTSFADVFLEFSAQQRLRGLFDRRAKGVISTNSDMERSAVTPPARSVAAKPRELGVALEYLECPGLLVVAVPSGDQLNGAIEQLTEIVQSSPRKKAVVIIPRGRTIKAGPDTLRTLALRGIAFVPSEMDDIHEGARMYADAYRAAHRESGEHLRQFMSSESEP